MEKLINQMRKTLKNTWQKCSSRSGSLDFYELQKILKTEDFYAYIS